MKLLNKDYLNSSRIGNAIERPSDAAGVLTLLQTLIKTDVKAPNWWSQARDIYLRDEVYRNPFLDSIVATVTMKLMNLPIKVISRDTGVEKYNKLAENYNSILNTALYNKQTLELFVRSMLTQDNGAFMYIKGSEPASMPLTSLPTGLLHLDSTRCTRTGDPEYPVVFLDYDGKYYKIHESRVILCAQSPSTDAEMFGVGYSFVSRTLMLAQHFYDIYAYEGEVLGSRSSEEIIYGTGVRSEDIKKAFDAADIESDNAQLRRYGKRVYIGMREAAGKLGKLQLKNLPENFQKRDDIEITLTMVALASGGSPNWFYDSVRSGSTKASAAESTKMGESKLELWYVNMISSELDYKFLPASLSAFVGDQDTDNNGTRAKIKLNLAQTRVQNIKGGVTDIRTERELQLQRGELSKSQFDVLELKDGRTSNGLPLYVLYQTDISTLRDLIYFTDNPLDFTNNVKDPDILDKIDEYWEIAQSVALNARTNGMQNYGMQAMYLLQWTREQYEKLLNVTARYEFNAGTDTVVDGELMTLRNELDGMPNDNSDPSLLPDDPQNPENTTNQSLPPNEQPDTGEVLNGINSDDIIDNDTMNNKEFLDKAFSTRHLRKYRQELRNKSRALWNEEIDYDDFRHEFANILDKAMDDNDAKSYVNADDYASDLAGFISDNYRRDGGKLPDIYEQTDRWVKYYIYER